MSRAVFSRADPDTMRQPTPCEQGGDGRHGAKPCSRAAECTAGRLMCRAMYRYYNRGPSLSYPPESDRKPTRQLFERAERDGEKA